MSLIVRGGEYKRAARAEPLSWTQAAEAATSKSQNLVSLKIFKNHTFYIDDMALVPKRGKRLDALSGGPPDKM